MTKVTINFYDKQPRCSEYCDHPEWTTVAGNTYLLCELDPSHLLNCVSFMARQYEDAESRPENYILFTRSGRHIPKRMYLNSALWWLEQFDMEVLRRGLERTYTKPTKQAQLPPGVASLPQPEVQ